MFTESRVAPALGAVAAPWASYMAILLPSRKCSYAAAGAATWVIQGKATVFLEEPGHDRPPQPHPRSGVSRLAPCASSSRDNKLSARRQAENVRASPACNGNRKGVRHQAILMPSGCNYALKGGPEAGCPAPRLCRPLRDSGPPAPNARLAPCPARTICRSRSVCTWWRP